MKSPQSWTVIALLLLTVIVLRLRGDQDRVPASRPLTLLPMDIGPWSGNDIPLESYVLDVLGRGVFLNRMYSRQTGKSEDPLSSQRAEPIGLFIGYFPTQRTGQAIHSPQNCLPGAGWTFDSKGTANVTDDEGNQYQVGDYLISNGANKDEVLYWYRSQGKTIASDYKAKWYTLIDSIAFARTDAALVRVITPLQPNESRSDAQRRILGFAAKLNQLLPAYIPD